MLCSLTLSTLPLAGCNKKADSTDADESESHSADTAQVESPLALVKCDDDIATSKLEKSIKESIKSRSQILINSYADSADTSLDLTAFNDVVESILIDLSNVKNMQPINDNGMVTCGAKVSLTLPTRDVSRANQAFASLEGESFSQRLEDKNITLNNNMLVSDNFTYVVGMQGGQTAAKIVGQPEIISAVSDIIAASQFEVAMANKRQSEAKIRNIASEAPEPVRRVEKPKPVQKTEPTPKATPQPPQPPTPKPQAKPELRPAPTPSASETPSVKAPVNTDDPADFNVPSDESIEMVIIEEEGTY